MNAPLLLNGEEAGAAALGALAQANYGHFTSLQVRGGAAQGLALHLRRLARGTVELFDATLDVEAVRAWMRQAAAAAGGDCSLRVTVFARGFDHRDPLRALVPDVLVAATAPATPPPHPLRLQARPFRRPVPHLKHVGTFPLFHHRRQARLAGYDDALFVLEDGPQARVAEGTVWNIGFWDGAGVVWPQAPALRGTGERLLQDGLEAAGVAQRWRPVRLEDLPALRGAFAINATGLQAVAAVDAVAWGPDAELQALLREALARAPWEPL